MKRSGNQHAAIISLAKDLQEFFNRIEPIADSQKRAVHRI
jgi:hypothetical protein